MSIFKQKLIKRYFFCVENVSQAETLWSTKLKLSLIAHTQKAIDRTEAITTRSSARQ